jgi:hypothetical protein
MVVCLSSNVKMSTALRCGQEAMFVYLGVSLWNTVIKHGFLVSSWNWLLQVEDCGSAEKITETPAEPVAARKATKREELEAKLKKLTAEKHRLVQMLKQV